MLSCRHLDDRSVDAWDAFVLAHPLGTFFHLTRWRDIIARSFRHRASYLLAERDGEVSGVLPLVHVKTRLFGNGFISVPFCVYGGPLAADEESARALEAEAVRLVEESGARFCEFRFLHQPATSWQDGPALYETFRKRLAPDADANLRAIPRKQRAVVRKGIANELVASIGNDADAFFRLYSESVRNLGTPVFPRRYFRLLLDAFPDSSEILTVQDQGRPLCAVLSFYFRDEVLPYYAGGGRKARHRAGHEFMYFALMRRALERGATLFDFGRSKLGTGSHAFKKNWGFTPEPLHYRYYLARGAHVPENNPLNPKYRLFIAAWKRLPLPLANVLGPHIVRGLG